jgi:hypothetical protein
MQVALKDAKKGDMVIVRDNIQETGEQRVTINFISSVLKSKKIVKTMWHVHYDISTGKAVGQDTPPGGVSSWIPNGEILAVIRRKEVEYDGSPVTVNIIRLNHIMGTFDIVEGTIVSAMPSRAAGGPGDYDLVVDGTYFSYMPRFNNTPLWFNHFQGLTFVIQEVVKTPRYIEPSLHNFY